MSIPTDHHLWLAMSDVERELPPHLAATLDYYVQETDLDVWTWFTFLRVLAAEPEPATEGSLLEQNPYTNPQRGLAQLRAGAARGYVTETEGAFRLTAAGRTATQTFADDLRTIMVAVDPLSPADGERLVSLLDRLVQASRQASPPPEPRLLSLSYRLMPLPVPPLPAIDQLLSCLSAYRDDSHVAAWKPSGLPGPAIEALTLLWRDGTPSLEVLHQQLVRRRHPREVYRQALAELRERGFVSGPDEALVLTAAGSAFRQEVEEATDRFFFAPWACLDAGDRNRLDDLLGRLCEGLKQESAV